MRAAVAFSALVRSVWLSNKQRCRRCTTHPCTGAGPGSPASIRSTLQPHRRVHAAEAAARRAPLLARLQQQAAHALDGWRSYFAQPILPSSLTCVLLFFNVVLSPGGLITAFLTSRGFDGNAMAAFRGGCASECMRVGVCGWVWRPVVGALSRCSGMGAVCNAPQLHRMLILPLF